MAVRGRMEGYGFPLAINQFRIKKMKMKGTSLLAHAVAVSRRDGMPVAEAVQIETDLSTALKQPR